MYMSWTLPLTLDRVLTDLCSETSAPRPQTLAPRADVVDTAEAYEVIVEMPGVRREDLVIELEKDTLAVQGKRRLSASEHLLVDGRLASTPFERRFTLGNDIDRSKIQARLEDGILTVTLPRKEEVKPQRIEVQVES